MNILRKALTCLFAWSVPAASEKELAGAEVVLTQAVEFNRDGTPGPGNQIIAEHAECVARWARKSTGKSRLPIIPQREIVLTNPDGHWYSVAGISPANDNLPATTWEVCSDQARLCRSMGWTRVVVVTFPDHLWRACAVYRRLGLTPIPAPMPSHQDIEYYSWGARRWYLRCRFFFRMYERLARFYFWKKDWIEF